MRLAARADPACDLAAAYAAALDEHLAGGGRELLRRAREIGRQAVSQGIGVLELAAIHHQALAALLLRSAARRSLPRDLRRAEAFAVESLSGFDLAHRGFQEALLAQRRLNDAMERRMHAIAQAVHDQAGQMLFAAHLTLSEAELVQGLSGPDRQRLRSVRGILNQAESELRRLAHEMRPAALDDLGLLPALRLLAGNASGGGGLSIRVEGALRARPAPRVEAAVYRVVQEALVNVARHAQARHVRIRVSSDDRRALRCRVQDDGAGFAVGTAARPGGPGGLGLASMRERLGAVGGALRIRSAPGRGTELLVTVPREA